jgi:hypothetical protein
MLQRFRDERAESLFRAYRETVSSNSSYLILYTANNLNSSIASIRRQSIWSQQCTEMARPLRLLCLAVCGLAVCGRRARRWSRGGVAWEGEGCGGGWLYWAFRLVCVLSLLLWLAWLSIYHSVLVGFLPGSEG